MGMLLRRLLAIASLLTVDIGAHAECLPEAGQADGLDTRHFVTPLAPLADAAGFSLTELRDGEPPELILGGYQRAEDDSVLPSIGVLYAEEPQSASGFRIRAALPFERQFFIDVTPIDGTLFGTAQRAIVALTRSRDRAESYFTVIDGASWTVAVRCKLPVEATAAKIAAESVAGPLRLFVQSADALRVYSLPDLSLVRSLAVAGDSGFALAQLDDDDEEEIVLANPGLIVDAVSGLVEGSYPAGVGNNVWTGRFGINGRDGFVARDFSGMHVYSGFPYAEVWSVPQEEFTSFAQVVAVTDIDGDDIDEVALADGYTEGSIQRYSVRVFDAASGTLRHEDMEPLHPSFDAFAILRDATGTPQIVAAQESPWDGLRVHALGTPDVTWQQSPEPGPFVFARGAFVDTSFASLAYSGPGEGFTPRVHVVDEPNWIEVGVSPPHGASEIPIRTAYDLLAVHSNDGLVDRLAVGGKRSFGSIATMQPADWSLVWQIGGGSSPADAPLGDRAAERLAAFDVNHDGVDDVLVGAGEYDSGEIGIMIAAFDGVDGALLWSSPPLGGLFTHVRALTTLQRDARDLLLVASSDAFRVFDAIDGTLIHADPHEAVAVAATSAGVFVGASDGALRAFDSTWKVVWKRELAAPISAIAQPIPELPVLVLAGSRFRWLDGTSNVAIDQTAPSGFASGNRWRVTYATATHSVDIIAGSDSGLHALTLPLPEADSIFRDGLD